eukprot:scaffold255645_cov40-Tisochrysis_lutea.AAC.1
MAGRRRRLVPTHASPPTKSMSRMLPDCDLVSRTSSDGVDPFILAVHEQSRVMWGTRGKGGGGTWGRGPEVGGMGQAGGGVPRVLLHVSCPVPRVPSPLPVPRQPSERRKG